VSSLSNIASARHSWNTDKRMLYIDVLQQRIQSKRASLELSSEYARCFDLNRVDGH
jgi:hypothetical protein